MCMQDVYDAFRRGRRRADRAATCSAIRSMPDTTLGPMVRTAAADFVRGQIDEAVAAGRERADRRGSFARRKPGTPYLAPQILVDVDHTMRVMREESFGPVVGIMKVKSRRGGGRADERQRLRPDRRDLDRGRGGGARASATGSRPAPCS